MNLGGRAYITRNWSVHSSPTRDTPSTYKCRWFQEYLDYFSESHRGRKFVTSSSKLPLAYLDRVVPNEILFLSIIEL
jgi:hypothetical protein